MFLEISFSFRDIVLIPLRIEIKRELDIIILGMANRDVSAVFRLCISPRHKSLNILGFNWR